MGDGTSHPSAYHKQQQGWLSKCNVVKVGGSSQVTLLPNELACDGVQLLQIPAPKSRPSPAKGDRQGAAVTLTHYYVEMRAPYGFDGKMKPMVVIYLGPTSQRGPKSKGRLTCYLLDQSPATPLSDAGLTAAGQSFRDPGGGLTITVDAIDAKGATLTITTTAAETPSTCIDGTPFTAPGPDSTSCGGLATVDGGISAVDSGARPADSGVRRDAAQPSDAARARQREPRT